MTTGIFPDTTASYTVDLSKARFRPQHQTINLAAQKLGKKQTAVIKFTLEPMTALDDYSAAIKAIQAKDLAGAEANLNLAVATDPNFVKGFEVLAMVQLEQKKWAEGLASAEKTLGLDDVYIVLLTAKGQEFDRQKGQEVGADLYMTKPFDPDALLQKARDVLGL